MTSVSSSHDATGNDGDLLSAEARQLEAEMTSLKASLDEARKKVGDTDFYKMTENVHELGRVKFRAQKHLRGHMSKVTCVRWSYDNQFLLSSGQDGRLFVWDAKTGKKIYMLPLKTAWVMSCAYSPSGNLVASGGLDNMITLFSLKLHETMPNSSREIEGHNGYVGCVRFIDEQHILSCSGDKNCIYWDVETSKPIRTYRGHSNDVTSIATSNQDPNLFVSGSSDRICYRWDLRNEHAVQYFEGHQSDVNCVEFFPVNSYAFASSSDDGSCRLWDLRGDQAIGVYIDDFISCGSGSVIISRSGRLLIAGYDDFNCHVWDLLREERVGIFSGHDSRVCSTALSYDGVAVATSSWDSTCIIWTAE